MIEPPHIDTNGSPVWHLFTVQVPPQRRESFQRQLAEAAVETAIYYPTPPHQSPAYTGRVRLPYDGLPITEMLSNSIFNLPLHPHLSDQQVNTVCDAVLEAAKTLS